MDTTLVLVAALSGTAVPSIMAAIAARRSTRALRGNGRGTHTAMLEDLLEWTEAHDRHHDHMRRLVESETRLIERRLSGTERRLNRMTGDGK